MSYSKFARIQNVAPEDIDLSHPSYFRRQVGDAYRGSARSNLNPSDVGQPGCTDAERSRFQSILHAGDLVDAYRELHREETDPEHAFSWRGTTTGKHSGRGMRIDHCTASRALLPRVESVNITGHGVQRLDFMGSDHSPVVIQLRDA